MLSSLRSKDDGGQGRRRSLSEERAIKWEKEVKEGEVAAAAAKAEEDKVLKERAMSGEYSPSRKGGDENGGGDDASRAKPRKSPMFKSPRDALTRTVCTPHVYFVCFDAMSTSSFKVAKSQLIKLATGVRSSHRRRASHVGFAGASPEELRFLADEGSRKRPPVVMMLGMRWEHVYENETSGPRASPKRGKTPKTARRSSEHFSSLESLAVEFATKQGAFFFKVSCAENWVELARPGAARRGSTSAARASKNRLSVSAFFDRVANVLYEHGNFGRAHIESDRVQVEAFRDMGSTYDHGNGEEEAWPPAGTGLLGMVAKPAKKKVVRDKAGGFCGVDCVVQ